MIVFYKKRYSCAYTSETSVQESFNFFGRWMLVFRIASGGVLSSVLFRLWRAFHRAEVLDYVFDDDGGGDPATPLSIMRSTWANTPQRITGISMQLGELVLRSPT